MMNVRARVLWLAAMALVLAGCGGYRLGPTNGQPAGSRSVQVSPFVNNTLEPRLGEYVMNSLRKSIQRDGSYRVDTHDTGDVILSGEIISYDRSGLTSLPSDVITVLDYEIRMTAKITARERATGKVLFSRPVTAKTLLRATGDLTSAERQAMPLLTDDLAKKTTHLLVDGTW